MTTRSTPPPDDWRRQKWQKKALFGKILRLQEWAPNRIGWDHDHCTFCGVTFSYCAGDVERAYATEDLRWWICQPCFEDFKEEFGWVVR